MTDTTKTEQRTSWQLAHLAGCSDPDTHDRIGFEPTFQPPEGFEPSAGATFLRGIEDAVEEAINDGWWDAEGDTPSEIADGAVPLYTHQMWSTFVDLAAYNEDPSELGYEDSDMNKAAAICLYIIAERLARAIGDEDETS